MNIMYYLGPKIIIMLSIFYKGNKINSKNSTRTLHKKKKNWKMYDEKNIVHTREYFAEAGW